MWSVLTPCEQGTTTASIRGREQIAQERLARRDDKSIAQPVHKFVKTEVKVKTKVKVYKCINV